MAQCVRRAEAVFEDVRVVVREDEGREDFDLGTACGWVVSAQAASGMGHSLAAGVAALADSDAQAVAILLGDMPWIEAATLRHLAEAAQASTIVLPRHAGQQGHPVIFGRAFWPALLGLTGDEGARAVVHANRASCTVIEVSDAGVLMDVDTPEALGFLGR